MGERQHSGARQRRRGSVCEPNWERHELQIGALLPIQCPDHWIHYLGGGVAQTRFQTGSCKEVGSKAGRYNVATDTLGTRCVDISTRFRDSWYQGATYDLSGRAERCHSLCAFGYQTCRQRKPQHILVGNCLRLVDTIKQ